MLWRIRMTVILWTDAVFYLVWIWHFSKHKIVNKSVKRRRITWIHLLSGRMNYLLDKNDQTAPEVNKRKKKTSSRNSVSRTSIFFSHMIKHNNRSFYDIPLHHHFRFVRDACLFFFNVRNSLFVGRLRFYSVVLLSLNLPHVKIAH